MIWLSQQHLNQVKSIQILPFFRSDHSYVYLEFEPPRGVERGKGIWKLNVSHLKSPELCDQIGNFWSDWRLKKSKFSSLTTWWEAGKIRLKTIIKTFSAQQAKEQRQHKKNLYHMI